MKHLAGLDDPKIAKLYAGVPEDELRKFHAFCEAYPYRSIRYRGIEWPYLISSGGGEPLLMLSGALTHPDISWNSIAYFGGKYRIVVPAYPAVRTMDELCDGMAAVLQHEGVTRAHVMGGSYGGFVGQVFARRFPAVSRSLVLSHTAAPDPTGLGNVERMVRGLSLLPAFALRGLLGRSLGKLMPADSSSPEMLLMLAQFREIMDHHLQKPDFLGILERTLDFYRRAWSAEDLAGWSGRILLVLGEEDPASPERVRAAFRRLYPNAEWKIFKGSGHTTSVTDQAEYQAAIDGFLQAQS
ncbi:MAG: alpha/beta hydrolase [Anaerolineales bacterium]|nr:alpha/beta hydrolase [Anaerolineales bacterium]